MQASNQSLPLLGTAGHIDHGKSALVQALTGVDPDRLLEEKQRGITIELGFARLAFADGSSMGVVDVPGHERFVRQMMAGASGIDLALLCIAADDGIMPQTIEHRAILELLAIPRLVVALTKCDLVDEEWIDLVTEEVRGFLASSSFADAPIIPVSAKTGAGIGELKDALHASATANPRASKGTEVRLPIDRVFSIKGSGTVATGSLWSGRIAPQDELTVLPQDTKARVRSVQVHGEPVEAAVEGNRVALNLGALATSEVRPGDFLVSSASIRPTNRLDAYFTYLETTQSGKPLRSGSRVRIAHGTREVLGRILFMQEGELLRSGESAYVQVRTEDDLVPLWRDRFVVRSYSPVNVIGGGKVLLCHPRHRTNLSSLEYELLQALNQEDEEAICRKAIEMQGLPFTLDDLVAFLDPPRASLEQALWASAASGQILEIGKNRRSVYYTTKPALQKLLSNIENNLLRFHASNPTEPGITKVALEALCEYRGDALGFDALLDEAAKEQRLVLEDGLISHPKAGGGARKLEEQTAEALYAILEQAGSKPPSLAELAQQGNWDASLLRRALDLLEKQGRVHRVNKDYYFTVPSLNQLESLVRAYLEAHVTATAAELKEAMDSSRKYSIPLLVYFDDKKLTIRDGDLRKLA